MAKIQWAGGKRWRALSARVSEEWFMCRVTFWSLFYNMLTSWGTILDTAMEPVFWMVDHFVRYLGPAFVVLVVALTTSVVVIFYVCLLPHKMAESLGWTIYHFIFGHWLLVNIVFHYFKAAFTSPGYPPAQIPEVVSICKKCIGPKPQRAHHCSICDKCIMKMDHHCPWLNNCVGHYNHRYFFLFCAYMWVGTIYVSVSAYPLFKEHFYGEEAKTIGWTGIFFPYYMAKKGVKGSSLKISDGAEFDSLGVGNNEDTLVRPMPTRDTTGMYFHHSIIYEFMLCSAVTLALGVLLIWHARLVTRAETSIEMHTNRVERCRQRKKGFAYRNPYDFGPKQNWIYFLGLTHGRTFWRHILLPSSHKPDEDGLQWKTVWSPASDQGILLL